MRLRIKFTKTGPMRYISHLDTMRFFQKALRRAEADVAMSEGFSPHMLMSFALPLSLGMTSIGEYFDLDVRSLNSTRELAEKLGEQTGRDVRILSVKVIPEEKAYKCMTQVWAADYTVVLYAKDGTALNTDSDELREQIRSFMEQKEICITKKTKKKETQMNLRPLIFSFTTDKEGLHLRLKAGSTDHIKCIVVMERFADFAGIAVDTFDIRRDELLLKNDGGFAPLSSVGKEIP